MALAERRAAKGDRRVWELHLSPRAVKILPQLRAEADMIYARLLPMISPTEIRAVRALLTKMSGNLESGTEDMPPGFEQRKIRNCRNNSRPERRLPQLEQGRS